MTLSTNFSIINEAIESHHLRRQKKTKTWFILRGKEIGRLCWTDTTSAEFGIQYSVFGIRLQISTRICLMQNNDFKEEIQFPFSACGTDCDYFFDIVVVYGSLLPRNVIDPPTPG